MADFRVAEVSMICDTTTFTVVPAIKSGPAVPVITDANYGGIPKSLSDR